MDRNLAAFLLCLLGLAACNKGAAREALAEGEQAIEAARPELEQYAPGQLAALQATAAEARRDLDEGRYTEALALAQRLPSQVQVGRDTAQKQKAAVVQDWSTIAGRVPLVLEGTEARAAELAAAPSLPRAIAPETFAAAQAELAAVRRSWAEARAAFEAGQGRRAVEDGRKVQARVEAVAAQLGLSPAGAMAAAAARAAAEAAPSATPAPVAGSPAARPTPAAAPAPPAAAGAQPQGAPAAGQASAPAARRPGSVAPAPRAGSSGAPGSKPTPITPAGPGQKPAPAPMPVPAPRTPRPTSQP